MNCSPTVAVRRLIDRNSGCRPGEEVSGGDPIAAAHTEFVQRNLLPHNDAIG